MAVPQGIGIRYLSLCPFRSVSVALSDACGRTELSRQPVDNRPYELHPQEIPPTKAAMQGMTPISTKAGRIHSPVGTSSLTVIAAAARASTLRAW